MQRRTGRAVPAAGHTYAGRHARHTRSRADRHPLDRDRSDGDSSAHCHTRADADRHSDAQGVAHADREHDSDSRRAG